MMQGELQKCAMSDDWKYRKGASSFHKDVHPSTIA